MKHFCIMLAFQMGHLLLLAQERTQLETLNANLYISSALKKTLPHAEENIAGSHYLFADLEDGYVILKSGVEMKDLRLKFDTYSHDVFFQHKGEIVLAHRVMIDWFGIKDPLSGEFRIFREVKTPHNKQHPFMEVLHDGTVKVFRLIVTDIRTNKVEPYSSKKEHEFNTTRDYFIEIDSKYVEINLNKSSVLSAFPSHQEELKNYAKKQKLKFKQAKDLVTISQYYESLTGS